MNGKYLQWTISMFYSEDWEINTEEVFDDFSYSGTGRFIIGGKKDFLLFISWAISSGYLNKYGNKSKQQEEEISVYLFRFVTLPHLNCWAPKKSTLEENDLEPKVLHLSKELGNYRRAFTSHAEQLHI